MNKLMSFIAPIYNFLQLKSGLFLELFFHIGQTDLAKPRFEQLAMDLMNSINSARHFPMQLILFNFAVLIFGKSELKLLQLVVETIKKSLL